MPIIDLADQDFSREVLETRELVLVDFWAPWCNPCRMLAPVLEQIAEQYQNRLKVCKINIEEHKQQANRHQILSVPTMLFFKEGRVSGQLSGIRSVQDIEQTVNSLL